VVPPRSVGWFVCCRARGLCCWDSVARPTAPQLTIATPRFEMPACVGGGVLGAGLHAERRCGAGHVIHRAMARGSTAWRSCVPPMLWEYQAQLGKFIVAHPVRAEQVCHLMSGALLAVLDVRQEPAGHGMGSAPEWPVAGRAAATDLDAILQAALVDCVAASVFGGRHLWSSFLLCVGAPSPARVARSPGGSSGPGWAL
jgi:hypothetical protein